MADRRSIFLDLYTRMVGHGGRDAARDLDAAGVAADRAGHKFGDFAGNTQGLRVEIDRTRDSVSRLRAEIGRTGGDKSLFGDLRREESHLRRLQRVMKTLTPQVGKVGQLFGDELPKLDFSRLVGESRGVLIAGVVGLIAASMPVIVPMLGAGVAGAVVGAAGVGGIAGGIIAAASDPTVKSAWQSFTDSLTADDFGKKAFVEPTKLGIRELRDALHDMNIGEALKPLAPFVQVLGKGVGDFGRQFMPGFVAAMQKAGPFLNTFAKELGETGAAFGDMLRTMANDPGAVSGLQAIMDGLEGLIRWFGGATNAAAVWWRGMTNVGVAATDWQMKYLGFLDFLPGVKLEDWNKHWHEWQDAANGAANATGNVGAEMSDFAHYLAEAASHTADLTIRLHELFATQLGLDNATLRWNEDLLRLRQTFAENGRTLAENTEAGLENRRMVLTMIQDAIAVADAVLAETGSQERANQVYLERIALLRELLRQMGLTKQQIDGLVGEYRISFVITTTGLIPKGVSFNPGAASFASQEAATMTFPTGQRYDPTAPATQTRMTGPGYPDVYGAGGGKAYPTPYGYNPATDPRLYGQETGSGYTDTQYRGGNLQGRQHGGPVWSHQDYLVGEGGPEILRMGASSGYVAPMTGGGGSVRISFAESGDPLIDAIFNALRHLIRVEWEGDPVAALGS